MKICPNCQTPNREGTLFCEECGVSITGVASIATKAFRTGLTNTLSPDDPKLQGVSTWGTAHLTPSTTLVFRIQGVPDALSVPLGGRMKLIIGRMDPNSGVRPEIDMTPYGAQDKGISRSHSLLQFSENRLTLTDMGSVNGTYLNSQRLTPNQPRLVRDGDEIRLGKLSMYIYYK